MQSGGWERTEDSLQMQELNASVARGTDVRASGYPSSGAVALKVRRNFSKGTWISNQRPNLQTHTLEGLLIHPQGCNYIERTYRTQ